MSASALAAAVPSAEASAPSVGTPGTLLVAGKSPGRKDFLYTVVPKPDSAHCFGPPELPPSALDQANGRLVTDNIGNVYQIHATVGLVRLDGQVLLPPRRDLPYGANTVVHVGFDSATEVGVLFTDAAVRQTDEATFVYVVPVQVVPPEGTPYKAAAKLELTAGSDPPYRVAKLYGRDPNVTGTTTAILGSVVQVNDQQGLRELELDPFGNLFLTGCQALNNNDWVLIFDEMTGGQHAAVPIDPSPLEEGLPELRGPTALMVSGNKLYLASSINERTTTPVFRFAIDRGAGQSGMGLTFDGFVRIEHPVAGLDDRKQGLGFVAAVTAITKTACGTVTVTGFVVETLLKY